MIQLRQLGKKTEVGLVLNWDFHVNNRWVCALTPYLVNEIIRQFNPIIISSQLEYWLHRKKLKYIISMEPGWAAPRINYDTKIDCVKAVFYSDPHYETEKRLNYFNVNRFDFVFSLYKKPFFYHFKGFPEEKFVHMPWALPDQFISFHKIEVRSTEVAIFGGKGSDAYDIRNWCREQPCVTNYEFSGVENKKLTDEEYFAWLTQFDAIVAAGSSNPSYDLVTPKYFEIGSAGALLIGQYCEDLKELGFNENNSLIFHKKDFVEKINEFKTEPHKFIQLREDGRLLIKKRHKISDRINTINEVFYGEPKVNN